MIRETLNNLPEGLGDTYKRILIKISKSPSRAKMAKNVFKWATVAKRPLHVEELKEAVAFEPDDKGWNVDKIPHEDFIFESCRGLIIKDHEDGTVHFAHHTVRQYLTGGLTTKVGPLFEISVVNANVIAGQICVAYLSFSDFETQITSTTPTARLEQKGVLESGGPLWIPSILGIRKPMFDIPYRLLRGDPAQRPSDPNYWKHLRPTPKSKTSPSTDLKNKYRLLSYVIDYWELHARWCYSSESTFRRRLESLALHKTLAFEFRPWGPNQHFGPYGCIGCPSPNATSLAAKDLPHISMMHYAAKVGNLMLLACKNSTEVDINDYIHHERYHHETLLIACRHNRTEIVKYLIQQGGYDISDGRAVNAAATAGKVEVLEYLLIIYEDSPKYQRDDFLPLGDELLLSAAGKGDEAVVRVLTEFGARLGADDQRKFIESAAMSGHDSMIRALVQTRAQDSVGFNFDTTALHLAAANGHTGATRALLEAGFPRDKVDSNGRTALHVAGELGQSAVAEILLEHGADPLLLVVEHHYGKTPFHLAAKGGHVKVLGLFMKNIDPLNHSIIVMANLKRSALHLAAAGDHDKAVRWLIENGADINASDSRGNSPLYNATKLGQETIVSTLLEFGARFVDKAYSYEDLDLLNFAARNANKNILVLFLEHIRDIRKPPIDKRRILVKMLRCARQAKNLAAEEVIEREFRHYPEWKNRIREDTL